MKQFVPFDDAWLDHPEDMPGPLVPYQAGLACRHDHAGLDQRTGPTRPFSEKVSPALMPS